MMTRWEEENLIERMKVARRDLADFLPVPPMPAEVKANDVADALRHALEEIRAWRSGLNSRNMNRCKVGATFCDMDRVKAAIDQAEGRS